MRKPGSMWQLLMAMNECGLKNDALMDTFYDLVMEKYHKNAAYAILVFHDRYDIPAKGSDGERQWESEEVFEYMICAICPMTGEYEPGKPECGFLFPAFTDRSGDQNHINIFQADADRPHRELLELLGLGRGLELPFQNDVKELGKLCGAYVSILEPCRLDCFRLSYSMRSMMQQTMKMEK